MYHLKLIMLMLLGFAAGWGIHWRLSQDKLTACQSQNVEVKSELGKVVSRAVFLEANLMACKEKKQCSGL